MIRNYPPAPFLGLWGALDPLSGCHPKDTHHLINSAFGRTRYYSRLCDVRAHKLPPKYSPYQKLSRLRIWKWRSQFLPVPQIYSSISLLQAILNIQSFQGVPIIFLAIRRDIFSIISSCFCPLYSLHIKSSIYQKIHTLNHPLLLHLKSIWTI